MVLEMRINSPHHHHRQRSGNVAPRQAMGRVVLEQQHVGRYVHEYRPNA